MAEIRFPIEASHVMMFGRAIGDPEPAAQVAPPTFAIAADHFDPDYERRPHPGIPWFGSGVAAVSVEGGSQQASGGGSGFHAEERFFYHRPIRVGDVLRGSTRDGARWSKQGRRGGTLRFFEHITDFVDAQDESVVTLTWIDVLTERQVDSAGDGSEQTAEPEPARDLLEHSPASVAFAGASLAVGESSDSVVVEDLKRTQIVMYAGASGDFHPLHTDAPYAQAKGFPGVFAHGMLTMGVTGVALTNLVGREALREYAARFRGIVWPGDTLTTRLTLAGVRDGAAVLEIVTGNQKDEPVLMGEASVLL